MNPSTACNPTEISWPFFTHEDDYPELDAAGAIERLAEAIRCKTTSYVDTSLIDYAEFDKLHGLIRRSYPHVMEAGTVETIGHSLLITIPGSDPSLAPALLMAHQDVVPVVPGTEADWTYDAFSGHVDDTFVWGRGTLDVKEMVMAELEAAELVLASGKPLRRTLLLAFGEDEECLQQGSRAIARTLEARGVRPEFLIDEGPYAFADGAEYGAPGFRFKPVELGEKGYCDVRVTARSAGGHSSNPFGGTSLAHVCEAVARIASDEWPVELSPLVGAAFETLAPHICEEPFRSLVTPLPGESAAQAVARNAAEIARACSERKALFPLVTTTVAPTMLEGGSAGSNVMPQTAQAVARNAAEIARACSERKALFPLVTTTVAPTMLEGGSAGSNVMPQTVWAVVNFRLAPGTSSEAVAAHCRELVRDLPVEVDIFQQPSEPSAVGADAVASLGWEAAREAVARYYRDPETGEGLPIVPTLATGGTDARMYEHICDACLRLGPMLVASEETRRGVHGTDERVDKRAYVQSIRVLARIVETTCC